MKKHNPEAERSIQLFKDGWLAAKFPTTIEVGATQMPRERYAKAAAYAIHSFQAENAGMATYSAALAVLGSPVGNPSGLMAALLGDGFLKKASAVETADALLEMLRSKPSA